MKKVFLTLIPTLIICLLMACTNQADKRAGLKEQYEAFQRENIVSAAAYVGAARESLSRVPKENRTPEVELSQDLVSVADVMLPSYPLELRIDVDPLLSVDEKMRSRAMKLLEDRYNADAKRANKIQELEERLGRTEERLIAWGAEHEKEKNSNIVKRIWFWGIGTFGVAGFIALCVFFPPAIPIIIGIVNSIIGGITSMMPSLIGFFGVVSRKVVDTMVVGVGKIRQKVKNAPDDKVYTKREVQEMIDGGLKEAEDAYPQTKVVVHKRRRKLGV